MAYNIIDLKWAELFQILARVKGSDLTDELVDALSYN